MAQPGDQRPVKVALPGPFSTNDFMPAAWSSVANRQRNCWRSISRPVARSVSSPLSIARLAACRAKAGPVLNFAAQATAASYTSAAGTTWSTSPIGERLLGTDEAAGEDDVLRLGRADQPGQPLGPAGARDDPEQDLRLAELRVVGRDPDVGAERELAAAAERIAGDRGHDGLRDLRDGGERRLQRPRATRHVGVRHVGHLLDVGAGREDLLTAPQHDRADVVAIAALVRRGPDLLLDGRVEGVHRRPVEPDGRDTVVDFERHDDSAMVARLPNDPDRTRARDEAARCAHDRAGRPSESAGPAIIASSAPQSTADGTNFAVWSPDADAVWLCLFDDDGSETRVELRERTLGVWHGYIRGVGHGQRYGYRVDGRWDPTRGHLFNRDKLLLDPYAKAIDGELIPHPSLPAIDSVRASQSGRHRRLRPAIGRDRRRTTSTGATTDGSISCGAAPPSTRPTSAA